MFTTMKEKICVSTETYKYSESNKPKDRTFRFKCANKKCSANVLICNNIKSVLEMNNTSNNHDPVSKRSLAVDTLKSSTKVKATNNMLEKSNTIIRKPILVDK